ncbi:MAG: SRPBCC domain-containing protein [Candidatus Thiodiazotropha taylori]
MSDYRSSIICPVSPSQAYRAIAEEMDQWWTPMSAPFLKTGDRAKTDFGGDSYWVFEARSLDDAKLIELDCVESHMVSDALDDPEEWRGTRLIFEFNEDKAGTEIRFTHLGLTPQFDCYEICKNGWDHYILTSLKNYLDGLGGMPNSY